MPTNFENWTGAWAAAIVADPYSAESIASRLKALLEGKAVAPGDGRANDENPKEVFETFVQSVDWTFKPEAFDDVWHAIFKVAKKFGCTGKIRDATYFWTETYIPCEAIDAIPAEDGDEDGEGLVDGYDKSWIVASLGDARLYSLGYGYSSYAWNAFIEGLGLFEESAISDSMRIGSCAQLLAAGQRLKLRIHGGGDKRKTSGFAGRYLAAAPKQEQQKERAEGEVIWKQVLQALEKQQENAGPRAAALLQKTLEHIQSGGGDLTSREVAEIVWPESVGWNDKSTPTSPTLMQ